MTDQRYYCPIHRIPIQYFPSTRQYYCATCDEILDKERIVPASFIEIKAEQVIKDAYDEVKRRMEE